MAGRPGTGGLTWKVDSCSVTATTAQMCSVVGRIESASNAAKMSIAQPSRFATFGGMRFAISARATSGSIGGSRNSGLVHADISAMPASTRERARAMRLVGMVRFEEAPLHLREALLQVGFDAIDRVLARAGRRACSWTLTATIRSLPSCSVIRLKTRAISARSSKKRRISAAHLGIGALPDQHRLDFDRDEHRDDDEQHADRERADARPTAGLPVTTASTIASSARTRPSSAARSSPKMTISSACRLSRNQRHEAALSARLVDFDAGRRASTPLPATMPNDEHADRPPPLPQRLGVLQFVHAFVDREHAADAEQHQRDEERPEIDRLAIAQRIVRRRRRAAWRMPSSSRSWLPQSASECTVSASIAPEPVMNAATPLVTKIAKFAPSANRMARFESPWPAIYHPRSPV